MLTQARLKELLHYDPLTGEFVWAMHRSGRCKVGSVAGTPNTNGHIQITVDGKSYMASRLAFLYMTGKWPKHQADHEDTHRDNNVWANLRDATNQQNCCNQRKRANNKSGYKGVCWSNDVKKFRAQIMVGGKKKMLGWFTDPKLAHVAYCAAAVIHHQQFARVT